MKIKINTFQIRQRISPYINLTKNEVKEVMTYYGENARAGWDRGSRLAKIQDRNAISGFVIKTASTVANTKIRRKDIVPLLGCALFSFTNPIVGMGVVGFALGKAAQSCAINLYKKGIKLLPGLKLK